MILFNVLASSNWHPFLFFNANYFDCRELLPLNVLLLSIFMVILVSKGKFLNSFKHQILHLTLYFAKNMKGEEVLLIEIGSTSYTIGNKMVTFYLFRLLNH